MKGQKRRIPFANICISSGDILLWKSVKYTNEMTPKVAKKRLMLGRSGTQYVAMVTRLLSLYRSTHLAEYYCQESNISDSTWLRYLSSPYLLQIWLNRWRHQFANLHILKTWISLERKEIFENSKQYLSTYTDYLFMF